jgi:hypothetical protein
MRIFVKPIEGSESHLVYESSVKAAKGGPNASSWLHDWTADGRYLVLSDVHFNESALYLLPLKNGAGAGNPVFVRDGDIEGGHGTASGAFVFQDRPARSNSMGVFLASLDPDGKLGHWQPLDIEGGNGGWSPGPSFSPDGTHFAYVSGDEETGGRDLLLRNLATGEERKVHEFNSGQPYCSYAYDEPKVFCIIGYQEDGGRSDLVSVEVKSGAVERLGTFDEYRIEPIPSKDGQHLYFDSAKGFQDGHFVRWEMSTRRDTNIDVLTRDLFQDYAPTPDEHMLVRADSRGLAIRPMSGGDWNFLVSPAAGVLADLDDIVPYGDWILFDAVDSLGKLKLYRVPTSGGEPQLIGDFPGNSRTANGASSLRLSRDGRQVIAVTKDDSKPNLWMLDNFEPPAKK